MIFPDRKTASQCLAEAVKMRVPGSEPVLVYGLPRGGVVCAAEIAHALGAPLELLFSKKMSHPDSPEFAIGAVVEDAEPMWSETARGVDGSWLARTVEDVRRENARRRHLYVGDRPIHSAAGKMIILVDDGIATGLTMKAAIRYLRQQHPRKIVVAAPVAPVDVVDELQQEADEVIVLHVEEGYFGSIGRYYQSFPQVTDEEVIMAMRELGDVRSL